MRDSDWSREILLRSDWSGPRVALYTTNETNQSKNVTVPDEDKDLEQVYEEILRNLDIFKLLKFLFSCRRLVLPHRVEVFFNLRMYQVIDQKLVIAWSRLLGRRDVARTNLILRPLYQFPRKMPWGRGCARIEARRIIRRA